MNAMAQNPEHPPKKPACADCDDLLYRLSIYEAGHALVAWSLGHSILTVRMLPRPAETVTEKTFVSSSWSSFYEILESRALELFGGQITEELVCGGATFFTGDVSRIDEITRILSSLSDGEDHEDIFFRLEDAANQIFADEHYQEAIEPVAALLYERETAGQLEIPGDAIEAIIRQYIPAEAAPERLGAKVLKLLGGG